MKEFKAIKTVYSYYLPEIRAIIDDLVCEYPHEVFLRSVKPGLDDFHEPIIDKLVKFHYADVPHLGQFHFRYPTAGSEEGIREFLTSLQLNGVKSIYVFKGDYEGFGDVAKTRGIKPVEIKWWVNPRHLKPGYWILSNPSARNGMILPNDYLTAICEAGHKVFYDLSYLGMTKPHVFNLNHPNIIAAAISFSKPYGLFYYRIGFTFSREPIPSLYANKWFKNIFGLLITEKIINTVNQYKLVGKYREIQDRIVCEISNEFGWGIIPSDVFILAHLPEFLVQRMKINRSIIEKFKRGSFYRFCLTPYFEEYENS